MNPFKKVLSPSLALGLLVVGWLWLHARDARQREAGRAEAFARQLDSATAYYDSVEAGRVERDSIQREEIARLQSRTLVERRRWERVTSQADSLQEALDTALAQDTTATAALVRSTVAALSSEVAACRAVVVTCDSIQSAQAIVIARRDSTLQDLHALYHATDQALQVERKRARPGLLRRAEMALPWMGAVTLVTLLLTR